MPVRTDIDNNIIIDLYCNKGYNKRQISEKLNCSIDLISYRLNKLSIPNKSMSECVFAAKKRNIVINGDLYSILNGEMLGDGCIISSLKQAAFSESAGYNKKEWLEYLINIFINNKIPIMGKGIYLNSNQKKPTWWFSTKCAIEFNKFHKEWYIKNLNFNCNKKRNFGNRKYIKTVPLNLILDPKILLHWYIGDGAVNSRYACIMHTNGFSWNEVEYIRFLLYKQLNISTNHFKNNTIYVPRYERDKMLEIIGKCPVDCYKYKWEKLKAKRKLSTTHRKYLINMKQVNDYIKYRGY